MRQTVAALPQCRPGRTASGSRKRQFRWNRRLVSELHYNRVSGDRHGHFAQAFRIRLNYPIRRGYRAGSTGGERQESGHPAAGNGTPAGALDYPEPAPAPVEWRSRRRVALALGPATPPGTPAALSRALYPARSVIGWYHAGRKLDFSSSRDTNRSSALPHSRARKTPFQDPGDPRWP